ncbi:MAG: HypC/HybG/HupF family hydrogenase formation chaperone [Kiritimatiellae bacterium]|nr:HypC/HybG/HupF family hydrogenase formation chaperone [Kiritimatiellia bacterium]
MCLAVPMKIVAIGSDGLAVAEVDGVRREIDVSLIEHPHVGCHVVVHAGYAIEILNEAEANALITFLSHLATMPDTSGVFESHEICG